MSVLSSLTNRIFIGSAVLVIVSIGVAVYRVNVSVTHQAEEDLRAGLDQAAALVDDVVRARFDLFAREARLIVDVPQLTNAVTTNDPPTVQGVADEYAELLRPDLFLVTDRRDRVLARAGRLSSKVVSSDGILAARPRQSEATWFWPYPGGVLQAAAIPVVSGGQALGALIIGFSLDEAAASSIKTRTDSDIVLIAGGRVVASTFGAPLAADLSRLTGRRGSFDVHVGHDDYIGRAQALDPGDADRGPVVIVLRSRSERLRFLGPLHRDIGLTGIVAVLVATLLGYAIARTVTRPLRAVTETMRRMAATGNLAQTGSPIGRWDDEDARLLATTFRQLTTALDRFQRELAQRERLSSLGRLSTVVAHEVRNPLMIIKSAARTLRKHASPEIIGIASSIDEEVTRLDRVVSDVLDFARPIRFDLAPADLVEICRDAAQAVRAGTEGVPIAIKAHDPRALVVTDVERLRAVIVNLLVNAQQAVRSRNGSGINAPVLLETSRNRGGQWRVEVKDAGAGIPPADLARVFEPFFTTRRAGSGLGLALARSVVEGLGGSITVESAVDVGTTVRIDLPEDATAHEARA